MLKHYDIRIFGDVQGVFFRSFAEDLARELSVYGFVKNMPEGRVLIEAEGREGNLKKFVERLKIGPRGAKISKVEFMEGDLKNYSDFQVR